MLNEGEEEALSERERKGNVGGGGLLSHPPLVRLLMLLEYRSKSW